MRTQIEFGPLTDARGCPDALETFAGDTADPASVEIQIEKLHARFGLADIVLVGDRGMLTSARIERLREVGGIGWVSCLRARAIRRLVEAGDLQLGLFDERNLAEITDQGRSPSFISAICDALWPERTRQEHRPMLHRGVPAAPREHEEAGRLLVGQLTHEERGPAGHRHLQYSGDPRLGLGFTLVARGTRAGRPQA